MTPAAYMRRAFVAAVLGGLAGAAWAVLAYAIHPAIAVRFDRDLPPDIRGFYPVERNDTGPFGWTTGTAELRLPGLDRREEWVWTIRARAARPDPRAFPDVTLAVDGIVLRTRRLGNTFERLSVELPVRAGERGATLTIAVAPTFSPGPNDPRALGIQITEMTIAPAPEVGVLVPPRQVLAASSLNAAVFGAAFGLLGVTPGSAVAGALVLGAGQAVPLTSGFGPFTSYPMQTVQVAVWMALLLVALVWATERTRRVALRNTARFAAAFSSGALFLELLVLLHPDKAIVDAVFQAHKFQGVLQGTFLMTSIAPGGYEFPYPVMLYLAAAPFAALTTNHVALLRIVVASASAAAGLVLYLMTVRVWGDRLSGAISVALYHLIPIGFAVQASANLTNAFGQSLSLAAIAVMVLADFGRGRIWKLLALAVLMTAAFLSHTSAFALLLGAAIATGLVYRWNRNQPLMSAGRVVLISAALAFFAAVLLYYGHFGTLYREQLAKIAAGIGAAGAVTPHPAGGSSAAARLLSVPRFLWTYFGWASVALAAWGGHRIWRMRARDRLGLALLGWLLACGVFLAIGILTPIDFRYYLAAYPAIALLGAVAASTAWRQRGIPRIVALGLLIWSVAEGVSGWIGQL